MAVQTFSNDVDNLFTTTLSLLERRLSDAIFKQNPLIAWLLERGRVQYASGGFDIREPIIYQKNPTVMAYSGYDKLNVTPSQELTMAIFQWRLKAGTISVSGEEVDVKNNGMQAVIDLLQAKIQVLQDTMREELNADMVRIASLKGTKDFLGLDNFIEQGTFSVVGGINGTTHTWWRNQWNTGALTALLNSWQNMYNTCTKGGRRPDLILAPQTQFERYEREIWYPTDAAGTNNMTGFLRLQKSDSADIGFGDLMFKGARIRWDEMLEDATLRPAANDRAITYFIDSGSIRLVIHQNRNFAMRPFQVPYDQDARVAQILLAGNLVSRNRRNLGGIRLT